ncbi:hypothetical protein [Saccharicrinis sp. FJH54]|uniref:hypothetical protein n=1 Tax=Saccharicrinis sp. FJH54 TaxID=3344665 RepID=UPI0035D47CC4
MKTLMVIISMFALMTMNSFGQTKTINKLLENKESKQELFNAIQNDHQLMSEFMQNMHGNQHAMMMWNNAQMNGDNENSNMNGQHMMHQNGTMNDSAQQYMMNRSQMMSLMHNNPQMMQLMMKNMVNVSATDTVMSQHLVNQMMQYPQMMYMMNHQGHMGNGGNGMMMNQNHHMQMNSQSN